MITKRDAYWYEGEPFATEKQALEVEEANKRFEAFKVSTSINERPESVLGLYNRLLKNHQMRQNFRRWLDKLDEIGEASSLIV